MGRIPTDVVLPRPRSPRTPSRLRRRVAAAILLVGAALVLSATVPGAGTGAGAGAQDGTDPSGADGRPVDERDPGRVVVANVAGLLDPVLVAFIEQSVADAERLGAVGLVLQLDSEGAVVSDERFVELARRLADSTVPVHVWVGPSGSRAFGAAAELVAVGEVSAMAPGTRIGRIGDPRLPEDEFGPPFGEAAERMLDSSLSDEQAREAGLLTEFPPVVIETDDRIIEVLGAPTVGDLIVNLDEVVTEEIEVGDQIRRQPVTQVFFTRLSLLDQLAHTVASPEVAYLLLAVGLGLLLFEFFTAGIGVAGGVGAVSLVLASYGLWVLPTHPWALALIMAAFVGFGIDVQTGVPRAWTVIAMVLFTVGTFGLYDGLSMSWITVAAGLIGVLLAFTAGMPSMVRTRFSTPTIGREWMVGESGEAVADVAPSGVVRVRDALWRAETNRATPIEAGDRVRVVSIEGLLLEVEPEEGGARDYRDRSPRPSTSSPSDA
jgi:membrane-bound serine protease (ClpP class)